MGVPVGIAAGRSPIDKKSASREISSATESGGEEAPNEEGQNILARAEQESIIRTAPGTNVSAAAFSAARTQAKQLPVAGGSWREVTKQPYQNDSTRFRDPVFSNSGAGWRLVSGRMTALATSRGVVWAGAADGGVWRSSDRGRHWTKWSNGLPSLSVGALAAGPNGSIYVGLGEANTSSDAFKGQGVFVLKSGASKWQRVGGKELLSATVYRVFLSPRNWAYAATSRGLWRHRSGSTAGSWTRVLKPDPNPTSSPYRTSHITDVTTRPGSNGRVVFAVLGWRGGTLPTDTNYNGFYVSRNWGAAGSFKRVVPTGAIDASDIGRTTLATSAGSSSIYAVVESPGRLAAPDVKSGFSNLQGVYVSRSGNPAGPWSLLAGPKELSQSGSAIRPETFGAYPGIQTWYDQYIRVDPRNPKHVLLGLEEIFESNNSGSTWKAIGPYWSFGMPCYHGGVYDCPQTTHPDQHAIAFAGGRAYIGNDGGVYQRSTSDHRYGGWVNTNRSLHTLQYYYAGIGRAAGGLAYWGGLQDNGVSLLKTPYQTMFSPFGGDGGDMIVDPANGNRAVVEYVYLDMASTTDGGHHFREISPSCFAFTYTPDPCDPAPRFIAPFRADPRNISHWVAGGRYVWQTYKGWNTRCSAKACDWKPVHDTGDGHSVTALAVDGRTTYAAWCATGPSCNPKQGSPFGSGIDTNYGGKWHRIHAPNLPNRYINAITVDPQDSAHVYAVFGGFSRRWIPAGGTGHVFESRNGGKTWRDISGNLPDAPGDDLVVSHGRLVLATDVGTFVSKMSAPASWARFGSGLPKVVPWDLTPTPGGGSLVAATHGRGLWQIPAP